MTVTAKVTVQDASGKAGFRSDRRRGLAVPRWEDIVVDCIHEHDRAGLFHSNRHHGHFTVTVTNLTKAGYVFDSMKSGLTKSITK